MNNSELISETGYTNLTGLEDLLGFNGSNPNHISIKYHEKNLSHL